MDTSQIDIQDTNAPDYVDSVALVKLAQRFDIDIKERFLKSNTPKERVELREWVYERVRAIDPGWRAEY
jgi:hypothetical protein